VEGNRIGGGSGIIVKAQTSAPAALLSFSIIVAITFSVRAWDTLLRAFLRSEFGGCDLHSGCLRVEAWNWSSSSSSWASTVASERVAWYLN
jgi:hypothetical protein